MSDLSRSELPTSIGLAFYLGAPSAFIVEKFFMIPGLVYLAVLPFVVCWLLRNAAVLAKYVEKNESLLLSITLMASVLLVVFVHPIADGGGWGRGSDSDDALELATSRLLEGQHPYLETTYLGNPVSQLPGSVILAVPFVTLFGGVAMQNVFWLAVLMFALRRCSSRAGSLVMLLGVSLLSPCLVYRIAVGDDYLTNGILVLLAVIWLTKCAHQERATMKELLLPAVSVGFAISTRTLFPLLLPLLVIYLVRVRGYWTGLLLTTVIGFVFVVVTAPFYFWDPAGFSPFHTARKLNRFDSLIPHAGVSIPALAVLTGAFLCWLREATIPNLLSNSALTLAIPAVAGAVLDSVKRGTLAFDYLAFTTFSLFFAVVALWPGLMPVSRDALQAKLRESTQAVS
ncbi:MAG: hypothetical protein CMO80_05305 [Verrucomicrobiales bacterium]|nr:hypothetical protein [Verrucomicrobiales bacterium]|tara:strand:- start:2710 stop:3906 length:1197 start_codon:yes stop_codon:yes gene_type:complete